MASTTAGRRLEIGFAVVAVAALAVALDDVIAGGFHFVVVGVRVSSWEAYKPFRIGVAAAIANAVYHATGKRIRELPITLDKLL